MAGPRAVRTVTVPLVALLLLANGGAAPGDVSNPVSPDWPAARSGGSRVVVFLKEQCTGEIYSDSGGVKGLPEDYREGLYRYMNKKGVNLTDVDVTFLPKSGKF